MDMEKKKKKEASPHSPHKKTKTPALETSGAERRVDNFNKVGCLLLGCLSTSKKLDLFFSSHHQLAPPAIAQNCQQSQLAAGWSAGQPVSHCQPAVSHGQPWSASQPENEKEWGSDEGQKEVVENPNGNFTRSHHPYLLQKRLNIFD